MLENATARTTNLHSTYPVILASHLLLDHLSGDVFFRARGLAEPKTSSTFLSHSSRMGTARTRARSRRFKVHEIGSARSWVEFHMNKAKGEMEGFSLVGDQEACASRGRNMGCDAAYCARPQTADAWFARVQSSKYSTGGLT